ERQIPSKLRIVIRGRDFKALEPHLRLEQNASANKPLLPARMPRGLVIEETPWMVRSKHRDHIRESNERGHAHSLNGFRVRRTAFDIAQPI
ncbi:hypothetical protein, partial [Streptobacillus moniliformis]|uniref:hypothetical protein n=1 Tax=Streptobacillus moniliformis TaxID=34105 RepID=UPI001E383B37